LNIECSIITAGELQMPRFVPSKSEVEIKWRGFSSNVYILLYYVALSTEMNVTAGDCRRYV